MKTVNVTKTYLPNVDRYKSYVDQIFQSGQLTNNGSLTKELSYRLQEYLGVKNLLLVSNGTMALQIAYKLLDLKGEVITTPFSFVATTSSLVWENIKPIFVDIDPFSFNIDPDLIERAITADTTAIVATHVFGNAANTEKINRIAMKYNLKVIYDAAHCFGTIHNGESILHQGDVSAISFHSTKIFHTIEGGALCINNDHLYEKAKRMINFGITAPYVIEGIGINAKMNEFESAMGLCMLDEMETIKAMRKIRYEYFENKLRDRKGVYLQERSNNTSNNYSHFPVLFEYEDKLIGILAELNKENIYPRRYFYPSLNELDYLDYQEMPVSQDIASRVLCLPLYADINEEVQQRIVEIIVQMTS